MLSDNITEKGLIELRVLSKEEETRGYEEKTLSQIQFGNSRRRLATREAEACVREIALREHKQVISKRTRAAAREQKGSHSLQRRDPGTELWTSKPQSAEKRPRHRTLDLEATVCREETPAPNPGPSTRKLVPATALQDITRGYRV